MPTAVRGDDVGFNLFVLQGMTREDIHWIGRAAFPLYCSWCWP